MFYQNSPFVNKNRGESECRGWVPPEKGVLMNFHRILQHFELENNTKSTFKKVLKNYKKSIKEINNK